jgi:uncharacterized membrane protein YeiH
VTPAAVELALDVLDYVGIVAFTVSGVAKGIQKGFDVFGAMFLGALTALGGGVIRDLIAGVIPPTVFRYEIYAGVSLLAGLISFWIIPVQFADRRSFLYADALGLAVFSALGADVAFSRGLGPLGVSFAAMITGCGGGIMRDVLAGDVPVVMHKEVYATLGLLGGFLYYLMAIAGVNRAANAVAVTLVVFALRILAIERGWSLPRRGSAPPSLRRLRDSLELLPGLESIEHGLEALEEFPVPAPSRVPQGLYDGRRDLVDYGLRHRLQDLRPVVHVQDPHRALELRGPYRLRLLHE